MIVVKNVSKRYERAGKTFWAVEDLSFSIPTNSLTLITGANGSGKTTLLSLLGAILKPTSGRISIEDTEITRLIEPYRSTFRCRTVGLLYQSETLIPGLTILENLMLAALPEVVSIKKTRKRISDLLELYNLTLPLESRVENLSGGEKQKVCLVRSMVNNPAIILADEPTNHLDGKAADDMRSLLQELITLGKTVIVVSHDPVLISLDAIDQRIHLDGGKICEAAN